MDLLTAYDGKSITYDAIGNPTNWYNGTSWTFTWQNGRQLARAASSGTIAGYTYDVAGIRDSKTVTTSSGTITYNYLTQNGQVARQSWTDLDHVSHVMDFIYDNNGKPYAFYYDGTLYYYITNLQGDVIRIIDTAGATICTYTYDAWGRLLNSSTNQIFKANPIRYRGYYYDAETGLYYLGSRYYDPQVKRFINADGYASTGQGFVGCNMFAYCGNNPIRFVDLNGCFWEEARDFFKNIYDNIGRIIGPDITVVYQSRTDDPDPTPECPLIIVSGEYATETLFEAGSSERIVTVQGQFRTDNIFESSIGIAINTGNYTWTYSKSFNSVSVGYTTEHRDQTYSKYFTVNLASRAPLSLTATVSSPSGRNVKTTGYIKVKASWDFIERCFQYTVGYPGAYIPALA